MGTKILPASSMNDMTADVVLMITNGSAMCFNEGFENSNTVWVRRRTGPVL